MFYVRYVDFKATIYTKNSVYEHIITSIQCKNCGETIEIDYLKSKGETDNVNHPEHYNQGKYEYIDVMLDVFGGDVNFCIGNAFKYLWRHGQKNGVEDIKKAVWYLQKYINLKENENED